VTELRPDRAKDLCVALLNAASEDEVVGLLKQQRLWDDRDAWVPYGNVANNRGIVGNQQSSPVAALVEKLVNSVDAILMRECYSHGIDPRSAQAPRSMADAVEAFLGIKGGRLALLDSRALPPSIAYRVQLVASGSKANPNYAIIDDGEGQQPDRFPDTFLSLLRENKRQIPFVQGKFNMGGTGVLQFAGENSFQLIVSKRQADSPADGRPELRNHWGFTLVRRFRPGPNDPQSTYVYLAPGAEIPSFEAESMPLRPAPYPGSTGAALEAGTYIKLWNYRIGGGLKTIVTLDLRYALEEYLQETALPIRVYERRPGYRANSYDTSMSGLSTVLANATADKEPGFDGGSPLVVQSVGQVDLSLTVLKEEADATGKRYPAGVFFNVNGQLHSHWSADFFKRKGVKLDYIADSLVIQVDCTSLPIDVSEDLFLASRDRMRDIEQRTALERAITDYLDGHPGLKDLNARRRQEALSKSVDEDTHSIVQDLVRDDPTLAALFGTGKAIKVPKGDLPEPIPFVGKRFPTFFKVSNEPKAGLVRRSPKNWSPRIEFETDAANDYFSPQRRDHGTIQIKGLAEFKSVHLWNGKATFHFGIPETASAGDRMGVTVAVMDESRVEPFEGSFQIEVDAERAHVPGGPPRPEGGGLTGIPSINEVRQPDWSKHKFNERSAVRIKHGAVDDQLDMFINMDNTYLRTELIRRKALGEDTVRAWYKYGLIVLSLGLLYRLRQQTPQAGQDGAVEESAQDTFEAIRTASEGMAVTIVPLLAQLTKRDRR
jgi:hypothetical protein